MKIKLTNERIKTLNEWIDIFSSSNNATYVGAVKGIEYVLRAFGVYYNVKIDKKELTIETEQEAIDKLIEKMKDNSINALWNLGLATGICWVLELFEILDTDYSKR